MENDRVNSRVLLLGVPVDPVTRREAIGRLLQYLGSDRQYHVATPNSEMIVEASRSPGFRSVLERSHLNLPDSTGVVLLARWTGQWLPERVTGVDTVTSLCRLLGGEHPVFLLGAGPGIAERAAHALTSMNPRLRIAGTHTGSFSDANTPEIIRRIRGAKPHVLLVAFGAPTQDIWIDRHLHEIPTVRVAMGVGGTFDFLAGTKQRAPGMMRAIGLEWFWRLMLEPRRITRIWNAVIVFPWLVVRYGGRIVQ